jgi:hypothetical protein
MTKTEQNRLLAWRLKLMREASAAPRNVAQTCRHFGLSRQVFYKWKARYEAHGDAGLCDQPRTPNHSPRATPREVVSKILHLRQRYHFGAGRIADYLKRFHQLKVARLARATARWNGSLTIGSSESRVASSVIQGGDR